MVRYYLIKGEFYEWQTETEGFAVSILWSWSIFLKTIKRKTGLRPADNKTQRFLKRRKLSTLPRKTVNEAHISTNTGCTAGQSVLTGCTYRTMRRFRTFDRPCANAKRLRFKLWKKTCRQRKGWRL